MTDTMTQYVRDLYACMEGYEQHITSLVGPSNRDAQAIRVGRVVDVDHLADKANCQRPRLVTDSQEVYPILDAIGYRDSDIHGLFLSEGSEGQIVKLWGFWGTVPAIEKELYEIIWSKP